LAVCSEHIRAAKGNPVTANELLSLLGRAWSRLLIYPGGLTAFGVIWLLSLRQQQVLRTAKHIFNPSVLDDRRQTMDDAPPCIVHRLSSIAGTLLRFGAISARHQSLFRRDGYWVLSSIVPPWLALALMPLPLAVALPRQIDSIIALALLEWPRLLAIRQDLRVGDMRRLAAALNSYPPLILATLALAQAGNSLDLAALARAPGESAATSIVALHWLGAIALALALPPALGIGPFTHDRPPTTDDRVTNDERRTTNDERRTTNDERRTRKEDEVSYPPSPMPHAPILRIGLRLRALGLVMLAALPWAGAEGNALALLRLLGPAALIAALVWGFDRLTRGQAARRWAWAYLGLDVVLLLALLGAAYLALLSRLA
jgi:hypothetical protein